MENMQSPTVVHFDVPPVSFSFKMMIQYVDVSKCVAILRFLTFSMVYKYSTDLFVCSCCTVYPFSRFRL